MTISKPHPLEAIRNPPSRDPNLLAAGSHVRHEKYGRGLVLRREGSGDNVKLTVSFPGSARRSLSRNMLISNRNDMNVKSL
jgi:DNA helicase-2/ATP-dependent DNA helicase PcrA